MSKGRVAGRRASHALLLLALAAGCGEGETKDGQGGGAPKSGGPATPAPSGGAAVGGTAARGAGAQPSGDLARGMTIYGRQCAPCHGDKGAGDGIAAYLLDPRPRNLRKGEYRLASTVNGVPTDEDLFNTLTRGMPGSSMPSWAHLPEADRRALVAAIRSFAKDGIRETLLAAGLSEAEAAEDAAARTRPGDVVVVPSEAPADAASLKRGAEHYVSKGCSACHGTDGRGRGIDVRYTSDGDPVFPRDFTAGVFKGGMAARDIYIRAKSGMPGSPMPQATGITDAELLDIAHFVRSLAKPGAEERVLQRQQTIVAARTRGAVPEDPASAEWNQAKPVFVALMPLKWRDNRIEGVNVSALHDGKNVGFLLEYEDATDDTSVLRTEDFSDAAAVQFSTDADPPFFGMGDAAGPVSLWLWRGAWQADLGSFRDVEAAHDRLLVNQYPEAQDSSPGEFRPNLPGPKHRPAYLAGLAAGNPMSNQDRGTPVENLTAKALGTTEARRTADPAVKGRAAITGGRRRVVFVRALAGSGNGDVSFAPGGKAHVAFAAFDGAERDRDGQKSVSIWHRFELQP